MGKEVRKKGKAGYTLIIVFLVVTVFALGFAVGMITLHIKDQEKIDAITADYKEEISRLEEETKDEITYIQIPERKRVYGKIPVNSFILENFVLEDGFMAYYDETGKKISHLGVDLSYHQQHVNWDELEKAVDFVILRCGYRGYSEGGLVEDEKFREYASECNRRGIPLGVYFYTQSITVEEAVAEAEFVLKLIEGFDISYPVAYDTEYVSDASARTRVTEISKDLRADMAKAFCDRIKAEGYYPMVYASENWMRRELNLETLQEYDFWAPQYLEKNDFMFDFTIWQYTDAGFIPGISTEVDLDISMVDYASFVPQIRAAFLEDKIRMIQPSEDSVVIQDDEQSAETADSLAEE
ncbi:MAG: glycoside hydrolase family 25 protein [Lachnospiraceae bacterium]|nr:glycoside hydrolase family 25 protein [Lachnospiraceae bacterium]